MGKGLEVWVKKVVREKKTDDEDEEKWNVVHVAWMTAL